MGFQENMRASVRTMRLRGSITLATGYVMELTGAEISSFRVDEGVDDAMLIGEVLSAKYSLSLVGADGKWAPGGAMLGGRPLTGATVMLEMGAKGTDGAFSYVPLGTFVVEKASLESDAPKLTLTGYDSVYTELSSVYIDTLQYPKTLGEVFGDILAKSRYTFSGQIPNGSAPIAKKPKWGEISLRRALSYVLTLAGSFACVDRAGNFKVAPVWAADQESRMISAEDCFLLEAGYDRFGPLNGVYAQTALAEDGSGEIHEIVARADPKVQEHSQNTLRLSENPLLVEQSAAQLLRGMIDVVGGWTLTKAAFRFRGDPTIAIGDMLCIGDVQSTLTRQKLDFAMGFYAECELGAIAGAANALRAITPEGGLNAAKLVGTIDGGLLKAESITARAIFAGAITAEKIAAGAVDADAIAAVTAKIEQIYAQKLATDRLYAALADIISMRVSSIDAQQIATDALYAALANVILLRMEEAVASEISADRLRAAVSTIADARIESADVGFLQVKDLASDTAIIEEGVGGKLTISRLSVSEANLVSLSAGELMLRGVDGLFYRIGIDPDGQVTTQRVEVSGENVQDGAIAGGKLIEKTITAREVNAEDLFVDNAVILELIAKNIDVAALFAREATINALKAVDIAGNESLNIFVRAADLETYLRLTTAGVKIGKSGSTSNILIDDDSVDIVNKGVTTASFTEERTWANAFEASRHMKIGNYYIKKAADGGIAFVV